MRWQEVLKMRWQEVCSNDVKLCCVECWGHEPLTVCHPRLHSTSKQTKGWVHAPIGARGPSSPVD